MGVPGFGGLCHDRKNAWKYFVGGGAGAIAKFCPIRKFEAAENLGSDCGVGAGAIEFSDRGGDRQPPYVVRATLVAQKRTVSAGAGGVALRVAAQSGGPGAGYENNCFRLGDGREREFEISDEPYLSARERVGDVLLHLLVRLRAANSGETCAEGADLANLDASFLRSGLRGFGQRRSRGFVSDAKWVGWPGTRCGANTALRVKKDTFSFGPTAIKAQNIVHEMRICDLSELCRIECQECDLAESGAAPFGLKGCGFRCHTTRPIRSPQNRIRDSRFQRRFADIHPYNSARCEFIRLIWAL